MMNETFVEGKEVQEDLVVLVDEGGEELEGTWQIMEWDADSTRVRVKEVGQAGGVDSVELWVKPDQLRRLTPEPQAAGAFQQEWEEWQEQLENESTVLNILEAAHINSGALPGAEVHRLQTVMLNALNLVRNPSITLPVLANPAYLAGWLMLNEALEREELDNSFKAARHIFEKHSGEDKDGLSERAGKLSRDLLQGYEQHVREHEKRQAEEARNDVRKAA